MSEHLCYEGATVAFRSRDGQFTVDLLQLNNDLSLKMRESQQSTVIALLVGILEFRTNPEKKQTVEEAVKIVAELTGQDVSVISKFCGV